MLGSTSELTSALVDQLDHGVWQLAATDGRIQATNAAAADQVGAIHPLSGLLIGEMMVPPMSAEGWRLLVDHVPVSGTHRLTVSIQRADASIAQVDMTLSRHRTTTPGGQATPAREQEVVLALTRPLSRELPDGTDRLNRTLNALSDGIALIGLDGRIESTNPAFGQLLDLLADQLAGSQHLRPAMAPGRRTRRGPAPRVEPGDRHPAHRSLRPALGRLRPRPGPEPADRPAVVAGADQRTAAGRLGSDRGSGPERA
ncbi:MAG: PAS domain-containing protein [Microthrixaceae bacterium]